LSTGRGDVKSLNQRICQCELCPRLRGYCRRVAREKRRAYADEPYWGKPVPNFGDPRAALLIVGLAPAAHGANRTGRMFTGDRSGEWLYRALHRAGFASQPTAIRQRDGLRLLDCCITAVVHCAPPDNKPTVGELANCQTWLDATLDCVPARVIVALGQIAWVRLLAACRRRGWAAWHGSQPKFAHRATAPLTENRWLVASFHPSQQNTFTGRLTEPMLDAVFQDSRKLLGRRRSARPRGSPRVHLGGASPSA
jgi:uracil-DNA glycosylase family 4